MDSLKSLRESLLTKCHIAGQVLGRNPPCPSPRRIVPSDANISTVNSFVLQAHGSRHQWENPELTLQVPAVDSGREASIKFWSDADGRSLWRNMFSNLKIDVESRFLKTEKLLLEENYHSPLKTMELVQSSINNCAQAILLMKSRHGYFVGDK